jgi:phosphatidylethanolamine-binding protein (PEBP) family uncharacterized protein
MKRENLRTISGVLCIICSSAVYAGCSKESGTSITPATTTNFVLESSEVFEGGMLPGDYTCDGTSSTLPLKWSGVPTGIQSYAVIMHHVASPNDIHWYWVLYNIPADVDSLPKNVTGIGRLGNNSVNGRMEYAPPCSQGPGLKTYTYSIYALSSAPVISVPDSLVSRAVLLQAIEGIVLDSAVLHVVYSRPASSPSGMTNRKPFILLLK